MVMPTSTPRTIVRKASHVWVLDGQRLSSIDITEPGTIKVDALSGEESGDAAQSPLDSPSPVDISDPRTANPAEATETLLQNSGVSVSTLYRDSIPGARIASPAT